MASVKQVAGKKKSNDETPNKTQGSLSNQEKKNLAKMIKYLEDENKRLSLQNVILKKNFDLREIIKVLSQKGPTELDGIEMAKDMVKTALQEADEKHSAEKKDLERKHEKEIEKISQKLQGADQQQTQSKAASKHSLETDEEIAKYRAKNKELEREVVSLKADTEKLNNNIKQLKTEKESLMNSVQFRNQDTIPKAVNLDDMHVLLRETTKEIDDAKSEKKALLAEKQKLESEIQKLKNENKEQKNSYEKTKDLMEKVKGALLADKQRMDANIKRLQDEIKPLKQSEDKNKSLNEKLKKVEEAKDNLNQQVQALQKENNELKYRLKESKSTQPTFNNPSIAELSDAFRPTKLSERYSQLYDNMWTDAFEEHNGKKEEDIIQMLRKRLLGSYEYCENVCREFTVQLTNSALALPNSKPNNRDIPIGYKKQLQEIKKNFGVFLRNDVKESYRKQNAIEGGDKTKNYIDACVELCWLMVIQDPPVVLETPASKDSTFDTNTYMTYTMTGTKVDFVVWPALRLHHGGPLLSKGVAQGKK